METIIKILLLLSVSILLGNSSVDSRDGILQIDGAGNVSSGLRRVRSSGFFEKQFKAFLMARYGSFDLSFSGDFILASETNSGKPASVATYSSTTLQESSVGESDRLKTDGKHLYVSSISSPDIKIFKADNGSATLGLLSDLYLRPEKKQLVALAGKGSYAENGDWFSAGYADEKVTELFTVDISEPTTPQLQNKLTLDGRLISSRRIGSIVYLVTRHAARIPSLIDDPRDYSEAANNRRLIDQASLGDMLPKYQVNGEPHDIFNAENCFYTEQQDADFKQQSVISLLAIDLDDAERKPKGQCFIGDAETVYASDSAIYLATTRTRYQYTDEFSEVIYQGPPTTEIHKFALDGVQTDYKGSASIEGHLGWQQSQKSFRMSEENGILRILSYVGETPDSFDSPARLHILKESVADSTLEIIATLPNGERGYLVTFRTTDPLYILDLSDPTDPYIVSALEIDGYSDLLIPVSEGLLLGIGKDAVAQTEDKVGFGGNRGAWDQGVKLSLIDINKPHAPFEKQKIILGKRGTNTAVSSTHHALTTLLADGNLQVNIPVSLHESALDNFGAPAEHPSNYFGWTLDALYRYSIDINSGVIAELDPIIAKFDNLPQTASYYFDTSWQHDRSVIVGKESYYLKRDKVFTSTD